MVKIDTTTIFMTRSDLVGNRTKLFTLKLFRLVHRVQNEAEKRTILLLKIFEKYVHLKRKLFLFDRVQSTMFVCWNLTLNQFYQKYNPMIEMFDNLHILKIMLCCQLMCLHHSAKDSSKKRRIFLFFCQFMDQRLQTLFFVSKIAKGGTTGMQFSQSGFENCRDVGLRFQKKLKTEKYSQGEKWSN